MIPIRCQKDEAHHQALFSRSQNQRDASLHATSVRGNYAQS